MKRLFFIASIITLAFTAKAQEAAKAEGPQIYNPAADAKADIAAAVKTAQAQHKNVLLQIGGNWCIWCLRFNNLVAQNADMGKYLNDNYVVLHVNWSSENKNEKVLANLGYPQRFGFPVFVVLDGKGNRQHTQAPGYLGDGNGGYSKAKIMDFFQGWSPAALDPQTYIEKEKTK